MKTVQTFFAMNGFLLLFAVSGFSTNTTNIISEDYKAYTLYEEGASGYNVQVQTTERVDTCNHFGFSGDFNAVEGVGEVTSYLGEFNLWSTLRGCDENVEYYDETFTFTTQVSGSHVRLLIPARYEVSFEAIKAVTACP